MPRNHYTVTVQVHEVIPPAPPTAGRTPTTAPEKEVYEVVKVTARADTKKAAIEKTIRMLEAEGEEFEDGQ